MSVGLITKIAHKINEASKDYEIGTLQDIRAELKNQRRASPHIFHNRTIHDNGDDQYAHHDGGSNELQFNIAIETIDGNEFLRYGIAFSLTPRRSLTYEQIQEELAPKVRRFNDYLTNFPEKFDYWDMWQWNNRTHTRTPNYQPTPIPHEVVENQSIFVILGSLCPIEKYDIYQILEDFDKFLPLYKYVERKSTRAIDLEPLGKKFNFTAGCPELPARGKASYTQKILDLDLRHNVIQIKLFDELVAEYGSENVAIEFDYPRIDAVVKLADGYIFYEVKTSPTARMCIREALGQLLEYSLWPGYQEASHLVVVGEAVYEEKAQRYIEKLKEKFDLPVEYRQILIP